MKPHVALTITSLILSLLLVIHVADDIARGLDTAKPSVVYALLVLGVWLYAALFLANRRSGHLLLMVQGIGGVGICALHLSGRRINEIAMSSGGFFFMATLFAMGAAGYLALFLCAQGLWSQRPGQARPADVLTSHAPPPRASDPGRTPR